MFFEKMASKGIPLRESTDDKFIAKYRMNVDTERNTDEKYGTYLKMMTQGMGFLYRNKIS